MSNELTIAGENLISSKRAADLSGYAQDYIGQLARKGLIDAKRVGGLWYVSPDSLNAYKSHADTYVPRPPQAEHPSSENDSIISFDGRDYVSAARAAKITGYNQDYVGQLARVGKILSRQIGNRWYVDRDQITNHKSEKDALLGAVQAESVGILSSKNEKQPLSEHSLEPFFKYRTEGHDLLPRPTNRRTAIGDLYGEYEEIGRPISIRRSNETRFGHDDEADSSQEGAPTNGNIRKKRPKLMLVAALCLGVLVIIASGISLVLRKDATTMLPQGQVVATENTQRQGAIHAISNWFEELLGKELTYKRAD